MKAQSICVTCGKTRIPVRKRWRIPSADAGVTACSQWCITAFLENKTMIDPDENEVTALEHAGENAGEYLESLGRTDLAKLSPEEWQTFLAVVVHNYNEKWRELDSGDAPAE